MVTLTKKNYLEFSGVFLALGRCEDLAILAAAR